MIRIDEIYNNTFWPWIRDRQPGTRLFFCDPPGHTDPEHLFNLGSDTVIENDYIFCHDQEPVHLDQFEPLFKAVIRRNDDIKPTAQGHVIVSERGEYVDAVCEQYGWQQHYYFYHGWACQDWYRGYNYAYLIPRARARQPSRTFISPNRIVGGKRDHRVLFLYKVFRHNLQDNYISAPRRCPYEGVDIASIAQKYTSVYPDIVEVLTQAELPRLFQGETEQIMSSYCLTNFAEAADSVVYVATETVYSGRRQHLTEKTFRAIALEMPFVLVAPAHSLSYLREYGFETFAPYIDESYDLIEDPIDRLEAVTQILTTIQARSAAEKLELWQNLLPRVEHNYNHFYQGGFSDILWQELQAMLAGLKNSV